jgi:hypothetical protein
MPELSRFSGIIIRMFTETGERHHMPHVHVYYQNQVAVYSLNPIELIIGTLPRRQQRLAEAWIEIYQEELMENWDRAIAGQPINKIPPLLHD